MSNEYDIARIYKDMEQEIISSMQRNLSRHIEEEKRVGFNYPQWQAEKLRSLRKYRAENMDIINSYTEGLPQKVKALMQTELKQGFLSELAKYKEALAAGYESSVIMKDSFFKINTRKVNNLIKSIGSDLAKANQACLRYTDDAYRKVIFQSEMYVANGVFTEKKAIEKAIDDFAKRGIHCIEYADGSMRDIADYADMAIKTASQRAQLMGEGEFRKKLGTTLIIISKHGGTCPLCAKWEGKILIDDVYSGGTRADGDYPLLSEAMAAGLYHPRCRHGCGTYYPEVEDIWNEKHTENVKGLASKSSTNNEHNNPQLIKTIDFNDNNAIMKELDAFEKETIDLSYERNCTVTADGKVWQLDGSSGFVETELIETQRGGSGLKGSYSYHNHPDDETWFSFSGNDVGFFLEKEQTFSKASDYKYSYVMKRTPETISAKYEDILSEFKNIEDLDILQMSIDNAIDIDTDRYHEVVKILSKKYNFLYERVKNGK